MGDDHTCNMDGVDTIPIKMFDGGEGAKTCEICS